jgi:hypothetical protein
MDGCFDRACLLLPLSVVSQCKTNIAILTIKYPFWKVSLIQNYFLQPIITFMINLAILCNSHKK